MSEAESTGKNSPTMRRTRTFSWDVVDPELVRELLESEYKKQDPAEAAKLKDLSHAQLTQQAEKMFGRPPRKECHQRLTDVLRTSWLPKVSADKIKTLTESVNRYDPLGSHKERLKYLQGRKKTAALVTNLWKLFASSHKVERTVSGQTATVRARRAGKVTLVGKETPWHYSAYPHQQHAWAQLDKLKQRKGHRAGLMVIPTGGGKTATMAHWIIQELSNNPELRVLWIADQQELVAQAVREFKLQAEKATAQFKRTLIEIHGDAAASSALLADADITCTTRQSLIGKGFDGRAQDRIRRFFTHPTIVVIDEAHHAVAPSYQAAIEFIRTIAADLMLVGLTATPWPSGQGQTLLLRETFPVEIVSVTADELMRSGDLASPVIHEVPTSQRIDLDKADIQKLTQGRELPSRIVTQLNREVRNKLVVAKWLDRQETWGKTLLFACDTKHADSLGSEFADAGVTVDVIHSRRVRDREAVLEQFRKATTPRVLISVGMLLEGVDIPSARTAFLCRPTTSQIVLRQMIGRVLRGVKAGGDAEAHIVEFVDGWTEQGASLRSITFLSALDLPTVAAHQSHDGGTRERKLPRVTTDNGTEIGVDLLRNIRRKAEEQFEHHNFTLISSQLVGFYDLDVRRLPVFKHSEDAWQDLGEYCLGQSKKGTRLLEFFSDVPTLQPQLDEVQAFATYCRSYGALPTFDAQPATLDVRSIARKLFAHGPLTEEDRNTFLRKEYEGSLAGVIYPDLQRFIEAVNHETLKLCNVIERGPEPESPTASTRTLTQCNPPRELQNLLLETAQAGRELLMTEDEYRGALEPNQLPDIRWTRKQIETYLAYWTWIRNRHGRGRHVIRVNRKLNVSPTEVSDELLRFLIWHELCHHLTPLQGHGTEFRRLEALWPDYNLYDYQLDALGVETVTSDR